MSLPPVSPSRSAPVDQQPNPSQPQPQPAPAGRFAWIGNVTQKVTGGLTNAASYLTSGAKAAVERGKNLIHPVDFMGQRYTLPFTSSPFPQNPYQDLIDMDDQVARFEQIQANSPQLQIAPPIAAANLVSAPNRAERVHDAHQNQIAATDTQLRLLGKHLSNFGLIFALHKVVGRDTDDQMDSIFEQVRSASQPGQANVDIKRLVLAKFPNLKWYERWKIHIVYFVCTFRGYFQKTVEAYSERILKELRTKFCNALQPADGSRGELIPGIIDDGIKFLKAYRKSIQDHAQGVPLTDEKGILIANPSLNDYKNMAIAKLYGKSLKTLCQDVSKSLLKHFFKDDVEYKKGSKWLNGIMNWGVQRFLKKNLPNLMEKTLESSTNEIKPHKLPFVKAIILALEDQIRDLEETLKDEALNPPYGNFPGTENLPDFVEHFLSVLEYGENPTQRHVLRLMNPNHRPAIDRQLNESLQKAALKPLNILLHYLVKPENTEKLFTKVFELFKAPFDAPQRVASAEVDYLRNRLSQLAQKVFKQAVRESIEEEIQGIPASKVAAYAELQFNKRKQHIGSCAERLSDLKRSLDRVIGQISPAELSSIYSSLEALKDTLKIFSAEEKISKKQFEFLPPSGQEAILRPLIPIYAQAHAVMNQVLILQRGILDYHAATGQRTQFTSLDDHLGRMQEEMRVLEGSIQELLNVPKSVTSPQRMGIIHRIDQSDRDIEELLRRIDLLQRSVNSILSEEERTAYRIYLENFRILQEQARQLILVEKLDAQLRQFLSGLNRNKSAQLVQQQLSEFEEADQALLRPLIARLRPPVNATDANTLRPTIDSISQILNELQKRAAQNIGTANQRAARELLSIHASIERQTQSIQAQERAVAERLVEFGASLEAELGKLHQLTANAKREEQYHPSPEHLDGALGLAATIGGAYLSYSLPILGPAIVGAVGGIGRRFRDVTQVAAGNANGAALAGGVARDSLLMSAIPGVSYLLSAIPGVGYASTAATATVAGLTGWNFQGNAIGASVDLVMGRVMEIFEKGYHFIINDYVYKGGAKIGLERLSKGYASPL